MKYMLIIYGNQALWESFSAEDMPKLIADQNAWNSKYFATGELLGAYGNADVAQTKTVRVRDGQPAVTDGPYLETKEYLASWYLVDVDSEARALELAAAIPFSSVGQTEVWPILHEGAADS